MALDFSLAQQPDFLSGFTNAFKAGQTQAAAINRRNAFSTFNPNDPASFDTVGNRLLQTGDVDGYSALATVAKERRADAAAVQAMKTRQAAGAKIATGDYAGAQGVAAQAGDFDTVSAIAKMSKEQREDAHGRADVFAAGTAVLSTLPYEQRKAQLAAMTPDLIKHGVQPDQLASFDPTDANLTAARNAALSTKDLLDQQTHTETAAETARHNRADEGLGAGRLSEERTHNRASEATSRVSAGASAESAATGRMAFQARKAAGGFGTPGAGAVYGAELPPGARIDP